MTRAAKAAPIDSIVARTSPQVGLDAGIDALGVAMSRAQRDRLAAYLALLEKWNRTYNLTAIRDASRMVTHHALDALAVLPHLPQAANLRVIDVGTGGGIPGVLLAIARPDWHVALLDANHKKGAFLTQATIELGLANAEVIISRVEDYAPATGFGIVVSRAFAELADFVAGALHLAAPDGKLYAMKAAVPHDEIAALPSHVQVVSTDTILVPGLGAQRSLVVIARR